MVSTIQVSGLSSTTTEDGLRQAFGRFGVISEAKLLPNPEPGAVTGAGLVTYAEASAANDAVTAMNGALLDGRKVRVNVAPGRTTG